MVLLLLVVATVRWGVVLLMAADKLGLNMMGATIVVRVVRAVVVVRLLLLLHLLLLLLLLLHLNRGRGVMVLWGDVRSVVALLLVWRCAFFHALLDGRQLVALFLVMTRNTVLVITKLSHENED